MEGIAAEVSQKLKSAIKAKLMELGAYVDEELPNYVMVMVTNRRSKAEMDHELQLFLGGNTGTFTSWLQSVWTKLEQVTVSSLGNEKRKSAEKKKKLKKSAKSSSESDDDRKHKKKRKASTSNDAGAKDTKKRKSAKSDISESETDFFAKESEETSTSKRLQNYKKNGARLNSEPDSDTDLKDSILNLNKKSIKGIDAGSIDEDDFLNIKEDFESEFLSDDELAERLKLKTLSLEHAIKKSSQKATPIEKVEESTSAANKKQTISEKSNKVDIAKTSEKVKDNKENKNVENIKENEVRQLKPPSKTIIIRNRKIKSRSRSRSPSKSRRTRSRSPFILETRRSRSRSRSKPNRLRSVSRSLSRSRSRSVSPVSNNVMKLKEKSGILDARELINRKRAMLHGSKEEKLSLRRQFTNRNDSDAEENERRDKLPDTIKKGDKFGKVILNKGDTKRGAHQAEKSYSDDDYEEDAFTTASRIRNDKLDLKKIKRTVFVKNDDNDNENNYEKAKIHKSVVNQIVKYIKEEPVVSSSVGKVVKISRPKVSNAPSASSTLIKKAMADAHKSLTSSKDEFSKKKELAETRYKKSKKSSDESKEKIKKENSIEEVQVISPDTSVPEENDEDENVDKSKKNDDVEAQKEMAEVEEYDPSQNMPQFVVTLTGLDPKLFPEDMELNEINEDINDEDLDDKSKPKIQEQCKYFPNCLAGDKCLYLHPTIPCKMFPNCKFGNNCLYLHPKCKFDAACTRYDCSYLHTAPRMTAPVPVRHMNPATAINAQPCKFYYNCVNPVCPFQHPKICRFDRFCTNKNCTFQHTSLSHVPVSTDKLRWSRPKSESEEMKVENMANENSF